MKQNGLTRLIVLLCIVAGPICGTAWALDEAVLTPTAERETAGSAMAADKDFRDAMSIWHRHRYAEGEKLFGEFAAEHPNSRWRAEAELHQGCYLTYIGKSSEARPVFERLASEFAGTNIETKA